jgi:dynein heavy chain
MRSPLVWRDARQIVDERFLVFINDLLSTGVIPDLFASDELDAIVSCPHASGYIYTGGALPPRVEVCNGVRSLMTGPSHLNSPATPQVSQLRGAAKNAGIPDTRDSILEFFINRVRNNLHVVLCFSPVGNMFRVRVSRGQRPLWSSKKAGTCV